MPWPRGSISSPLAPGRGDKGLGLVAMRLLLERLCTLKHTHTVSHAHQYKHTHPNTHRRLSGWPIHCSLVCSQTVGLHVLWSGASVGSCGLQIIITESIGQVILESGGM